MNHQTATLQHLEHVFLELSVFMEVTTPTIAIQLYTFGQTLFTCIDGSILDPSVGTNDEVFDPWGRPGAGAPIKNNSGQVVTTTQNHFNDKKQVTYI